MGLPLLESSDEEQIEEKKKEETEDEKNPESSQLDEGNKKELDKPVKYGIREWDRGKVGYMRWVEGRREEREEEFAPPRLYFQNK
jgi:DNA-directed RNA polymerase subunit K/omega